jgi:hypothetical protein
MNIDRKKLELSLDAFTKISQAKATEQFLELIKIAQCADIAAIAHQNLDMRFKNPLISNHIKRIAESSAAIRSELRINPKYGFRSADNDYTEDAAGELYMLLSYAIRFGKDGISALTENLRLQLEEPEKVKEFWAAMNQEVGQ